MRSSLAFRLLALLLALCAGTAAAAPPCLDGILGGGDQGESIEGEPCQDDCGSDEDDCDAACEGCDCCPLRAPATVSIPAARAPTSTLRSLETETPAPPAARSLEEVFRPPRRSA